MNLNRPMIACAIRLSVNQDGAFEGVVDDGVQPALSISVRSRMKKSMIVRILLQIMLLSSTLLSMAACAGDTGRVAETYLIPEGYVGSFYVIYGLPAGEPPAVDKDGARLFRVPESGVLLTQAAPFKGSIDWSNVRFFYVVDEDARTEIKDRWTTSVNDTHASRADTTRWIFGPSTGTYQQTPDECPIKHASFQVGSKSDVLDGIGYFDLESEQGLGKIEPAILQGACQ